MKTTLTLVLWLLLVTPSAASQVEPVFPQQPLLALSKPEGKAPSQQVKVELLSDPLFKHQWYLDSWGQEFAGVKSLPGADVSAVAAWEQSSGQGVDVAVIDTGVAEHNDLKRLLPGKNFLNNTTDTFDYNNHGTIIAGLIAAANNDIGIVGLAYNSKIKPLKISQQGTTDMEYMTQAVKSLTAPIANISFGASGYTTSFRNAIIQKPGVLFIVAAGNDAINVDNKPVYPCSLDLDNILCVAASTQRDQLANWSNYGQKAVDLLAPGENLLSLGNANDYLIANGTSFAAPLVTATAALLKNRNPQLTPVQLKQRILDSVDPLPAPTVTGGRLNAEQALQALTSNPPTVPPLLTVTRLAGKKIKYRLLSSAAQQQFECRLNQQRLWSGCASPLVIDSSRLSGGKHKLTVRAIDQHGIASQATTVYFFNSFKPIIGKLRYSLYKRKVIARINIRRANKVLCSFAGKKFTRCNPRRVVFKIKRGRNVLRVKAINKHKVTVAKFVITHR